MEETGKSSNTDVMPQVLYAYEFCWVFTLIDDQ